MQDTKKSMVFYARQNSMYGLRPEALEEVFRSCVHQICSSRHTL
jgi:hypothetical protein